MPTWDLLTKSWRHYVLTYKGIFINIHRFGDSCYAASINPNIPISYHSSKRNIVIKLAKQEICHAYF